SVLGTLVERVNIGLFIIILNKGVYYWYIYGAESSKNQALSMHILDKMIMEIRCYVCGNL
ncbi:hypothetical protein P3514_31240, partial [Vibrio parahaemolyticus]|nr:hypothetical protein [Vibrio parahaemolyticus]